MKVAILTTDNREHFKDYDATVPYFGAAPEALLEGFARLIDADPRSRRPEEAENCRKERDQTNDLQTGSLSPSEGERARVRGNVHDVEIHIISCARARMSSPEKLGPNIFFHGLYVGKIGWMRTLYLGCIRATRKKLREIRPDLVHGQGTERNCALSAVLSGFPNVVTIHGNMAELARLFREPVGSFGWLAARLEDFTLRGTAGVFCNSEYTEKLVESRARRTWRVPNALREKFFASPVRSSRPALEEKRDRCVLINVGAVTPRKRQIELLELATRLRAAGLDFELWFVGPASTGNAYAADFLNRVKTFEQEGRIRYLGSKSVDELIALFDHADALVHFPSEEAFGLVVAEGLARRLKLFGARTGGIVDIAGDIPEAELFEINDWGGLEQSLKKWIGAGYPRTTSGADLMRARYHPDVVAQRHLEIYDEILREA